MFNKTKPAAASPTDAPVTESAGAPSVAAVDGPQPSPDAGPAETIDFGDPLSDIEDVLEANPDMERPAVMFEPTNPTRPCVIVLFTSGRSVAIFGDVETSIEEQVKAAWTHHARGPHG